MGICGSDEKKDADIVGATKAAGDMTKQDQEKLAKELTKKVMKQFDADKSKKISQAESSKLL